jgi:hypothetical protein
VFDSFFTDLSAQKMNDATNDAKAAVILTDN